MKRLLLLLVILVIAFLLLMPTKVQPVAWKPPAGWPSVWATARAAL